MLLALALLCSCVPKPAPAPAADSESDPAAFARQVDAKLMTLWKASEGAYWAYQTDLTPEKEARAAASDEAVMAYLSEVIPLAASYAGRSMDPDTERMLGRIKIGTSLPAPEDEALRGELAGIAAKLGGIYGKGTWCRAEGDCLDLGQIEEILAQNRDPAAQLAAWEGWHRIAVPMRQDYARFVELGNQGAREIGYANVGELWKSGYDMTPLELEVEVDRLWAQVKPLYDQLHCHVRAELNAEYGDAVVPPTGPIPAHLTGNMWAQDWAALYPLVEPFPGQPSLDVNATLAREAWDPIRMVKTGEAFFTSMGLDPMPQTFWERSMFTKPPDRDVVCHASAWDVEWNDDQRIKMCIRPTFEDLVTIHHELGHNYYNHYYVGLPALYRAGAHDGFHEAIGDAVALAITPSYLKQVGLLDAASEAPEAVINQQMNVALQRVAFLPFGLVVDRWRWEVFDGRIPADAYNAGWWRLRSELQGVAPSSPRGEDLFDPGAKYHIPGNTPYLRYFLAHVLQFQLYRAMCDASGHDGPLHTCSFYGSEEAGDKLKAILELGASKPWPDALEAGTGQREMDASALLEYFDPLMGWLKTQNEGRTCGW